MFEDPIVMLLSLQVDARHINVEVLSAVQLLVETVASTSRDLLGQIYEHLVFDFGIWTRAKFHTEIGKTWSEEALVVIRKALLLLVFSTGDAS